MNTTAKRTWGKRQTTYFFCLLMLVCIGLLVAALYWRKTALSIRAENKDLLESLENLRQANTTDHELQNKIKELEHAHQFDSYRIQQLQGESQNLGLLSNKLSAALKNNAHLLRQMDALESENIRLKWITRANRESPGWELGWE